MASNHLVTNENLLVQKENYDDPKLYANFLLLIKNLFKNNPYLLLLL